MSEDQLPEEEFYTEYDIISSCCNAIAAVDSYDPITSIGKQRKNRIINRSIIMIDESIAQLYQMFKKEGDEEDEE